AFFLLPLGRSLRTSGRTVTKQVSSKRGCLLSSRTKTASKPASVSSPDRSQGSQPPRIAPPQTPAPRRTARRRSPGQRVAAFALLLLLAGGLLIGARLYHLRRLRTAPAGWGMAPSPEELALRRAVAVRPSDGAAHRRVAEYYL